MKIDRIEILPADMPQSDPKWRFAIHANRISQGWLVAIVADDGTVGYGYASATKHMGASSEGLKGVLDDFTRLLIGRDPFDIEPIMADLDHRLRGMNQAKAAIDCALHEIAARALGVPLCTLFGGKFRSEFPVLRVLSLKRPDEMAGKARELVDAGYRDIKIKVDGHLDLDAARVRAIRDEVGPDNPAHDRRQPGLQAQGRGPARRQGRRSRRGDFRATLQRRRPCRAEIRDRSFPDRGRSRRERGLAARCLQARLKPHRRSRQPQGSRSSAACAIPSRPRASARPPTFPAGSAPMWARGC